MSGEPPTYQQLAERLQRHLREMQLLLEEVRDDQVAEAGAAAGLRGGQPETNLQARRTAALTTAMAALRYARDIVQDVAGDLDGQAQLLVGQLLAKLPAADVDLVEVDRFRRFAARLLADVFTVGQLQTSPIRVEDWPPQALAGACLRAFTTRLRHDATGPL